MILVTCDCKKLFYVDVPAKDFEFKDQSVNTFLIAKCPHCNMLTRCKQESMKEIEKGLYAGRMEINERKE